MKSTILLTSPSKALILLIEQLGLDYELSTPRCILSQYSLIVVENCSSENYSEYVSNGGILLDLSGDIFKKLTGNSISSRYCCSTIANNLDFPHEQEQLDLFQFVKTVNRRVAAIANSGDGIVAFWGISLPKIFNSIIPLRKQFPVPFRRNPSEELSLKSKGGVSRLFESLLKELHFRKSYPYIHKAHYETEKPPLLFRIDSDFASVERVERWHSKAEDKGIRTTWFLHTEAHESWLSKFTEFPNDELALHCYKHISKNSPEDMKKGTSLLRENGISPRGYVAPYGIWSRFIPEAARELGLEYSSEFELLYDSLPFPSELNCKEYHLQIPIHPICINSLTSYRMPNELISRYFNHQIELQLHRNGPVALYDHLAHDKEDLMIEILQSAIDRGCTPTTFIEYKEFWQKRLSSSLTADLTEKSVTCEVTVFIWNSHSSYQRSDNGELSEEMKRAPFPELLPVRYLRRFNPKLHYISILNRFKWRKRS